MEKGCRREEIITSTSRSRCHPEAIRQRSLEDLNFDRCTISICWRIAITQGAPPSFWEGGSFFSLVLTLALLFFSAPASAQQPTMPAMEPQHQHTHAGSEASQIEFPKLGRAQQNADSSLFTLDSALQIARENNPTFRQAEAGIKAAHARAQQAGLYPNPTVGYAGDEIRGGEIHGGKQGFFVQQTIVTGGKLSRARNVAEKSAELAAIEAEEQRVRVETAVKMAFYRVLAAQELAGAQSDLARIAEQILETQRRLQNTGQADESEELAAAVEAARMKLSARMKENTLREEWRSLAAVIGKPDVPLETVAGDLEHGWPALDELQAVEMIATQSPAVHITSATTDRAQFELASAQREKIPDVTARAGIEYNHELLNSVPFATGWQANAELAVQLPIFNHNQGNIAAARADIIRAEAEKQRVALTLRERAATVVDEYANARLMAEQYRAEIMPLAKKSYSLISDRYGEMLASFPRVLESKRKLYELQTEYIGSLETVWTTGLALQGFLLTDGLEAPTLPGEMDRTIRETNVPMPERTRLP
jgi:cobalt-zinc-cadmium efflux system outer membrane protein